MDPAKLDQQFPQSDPATAQPPLDGQVFPAPSPAIHGQLLDDQLFEWQPYPKFQDRRWVNALLLLLTLAATTVAGGEHYLSFQADFQTRTLAPVTWPLFLVHGLWYSLTILAILGFHELGHYLACRYYDVDASLPFFIPMPFVPTGTMGAFIRIREPIRDKRALFDIGIAGPIAGFVVAVPALIVGLWLSRVAFLPKNFAGLSLGEPLLFKAVSWVFWGSVPETASVNLHPMAFAAWFGLLATALNLFPIGQLDGGHISYAVLGRRSTTVTVATILIAFGLGYFVASSWIVWTGLMVALLLLVGRSFHHPRTIDEDVPLDRTRLILAAFAVIIFVLCFTPAPITEFTRH